MSSHGGGGPLIIIEAPLKFLEGFGVNVKYVLVGLGLSLAVWSFFLLDLNSSKVFTYMIISAPVWAPVVFFYLFFENWLYYVRKEFNLSQGRVTLEIKIPQEIFKSPEAMELVLIQLYQTASPDNHLQTYVDGKNPPTYSLELVSRGGDVKFYMNVPYKKFKNMTETNLYAQYPGIEVHELDIDYTAEIPWDTSKFAYFSLHFGLKKADAYPIKTYIEYGLDKMPKEEEKIDPLSTVLEMLGSIGPDEHIWIQILITANRDTNFQTGTLGVVPDWKVAAREEISNIIKKAAERVGADEKAAGVNINQILTDAEKDTIKAIERSLGKVAFDTVIRSMYIAKKENFLPGERIGGIITCWRAFDDLNRNQIGFKWRTDFNWNMWQDPHGHRREHMKQQELNEYKRRAYTEQNHVDGPKVMTTEELATVFHLPGKVVTTPSLGRIPSKRSEPPANLPIG